MAAATMHPALAVNDPTLTIHAYSMCVNSGVASWLTRNGIVKAPTSATIHQALVTLLHLLVLHPDGIVKAPTMAAGGDRM